MRDITAEMVEAWLGSDKTKEKAISVIVDILNGCSVEALADGIREYNSGEE